MKKAWVLSYPLSAQRRLWSDWVDAQTDLSLRWAHTHFVGFVMSWLMLLLKTMWVFRYKTHNWTNSMLMQFLAGWSSEVIKSRWKGNDQEPMQSNSTSFPRHHTGKEQNKSRWHRIKQHKRKAKRSALSQQMSTQAILNNINTWSNGQTIKIRINHIRSTTLEQSVINCWGA